MTFTLIIFTNTKLKWHSTWSSYHSPNPAHQPTNSCCQSCPINEIRGFTTWLWKQSKCKVIPAFTQLPRACDELHQSEYSATGCTARGKGQVGHCSLLPHSSVSLAWAAVSLTICDHWAGGRLCQGPAGPVQSMDCDLATCGLQRNVLSRLCQRFHT